LLGRLARRLNATGNETGKLVRGDNAPDAFHHRAGPCERLAGPDDGGVLCLIERHVEVALAEGEVDDIERV